MSTNDLSNCIIDKKELKKIINDIIGGLEKGNTELQGQIAKCKNDNTILQNENDTLKKANQLLKEGNAELKIQIEGHKGNSNEQNNKLSNRISELIEEKMALTATSLEQVAEIENLRDNMNKIISTLTAERNQLLQRLQEEAEQAKTVLQEAEKALADAAVRAAEAEAEAKEARNILDDTLNTAVAKEEKATADAEKEKELAEAKAALEQAQAEAKKEAEAQRKMESNKTESMKNIEKIQQQLGINIQDIQSELWKASKTYMTTQYDDNNFKDNIADDPFVQAELKTLLNDTIVLGDANAIQEAHKNVIARHYNTLYPNVSVNNIMEIESPLDIKDHIVIPPYLYLSLTDYFVVFSVTNDGANMKNINMSFLNSNGKNNKNNKNPAQELSLEKGFHIIIKKLGNGTEDFFSRIDVKFVLLNTPQNASQVIDQVFDISTFYGHIPTQTILSIDESSTSTSTRSGGSKTLKNNKKKLKKKKKYTQNRHLMKKLKH